MSNVSEGSSVQSRALRLGRRGRGSEARSSDIKIFDIVLEYIHDINEEVLFPTGFEEAVERK